MQERTVTKRIVKSKVMADMFVWLGFEYKKTDEGYEFERTVLFDSVWKDIHAIRDSVRKWED